MATRQQKEKGPFVSQHARQAEVQETREKMEMDLFQQFSGFQRIWVLPYVVRK